MRIGWIAGRPKLRSVVRDKRSVTVVPRFAKQKSKKASFAGEVFKCAPCLRGGELRSRLAKASACSRARFCAGGVTQTLKRAVALKTQVG